MRPALPAFVGCAALITNLVMAAPVSGQEVEPADPQFRREVLLENTHVRVLELQYEPNGASPRHTHPWPRVVYVIEGGILELEDRQGERVRLEVEAGQAVWRPEETHIVWNVGRSPVRTLEVEIKAPPTADSPGPSRHPGARFP